MTPMSLYPLDQILAAAIEVIIPADVGNNKRSIFSKLKMDATWMDGHMIHLIDKYLLW